MPQYRAAAPYGEARVLNAVAHGSIPTHGPIAAYLSFSLTALLPIQLLLTKGH